jgi:hypothetical protein
MRTATLIAAAILMGCGQQGADAPESQQVAAPAPLIEFEAPAPLAIPAAKVASSEQDWPAIVHNKEIEVLKVLNIINPVAAFVTAGFDKYGDRFSDVVQEEWQDTQVQLGRALELYGSCKERKAAGAYDKQLALDMEEVWQLLVKTGVAGVRTKTMVEAEARRLTRA